MRFNIILPNGNKLATEVTIPGSPPDSAASRRQFAIGLPLVNDPQHARLVRPLLDAVTPGIAAGIEPHLPPATPAIKRVQVIEDPGKGTTTTSTTTRPEMPPPAVLTQQIAERLAPYVVNEQLVAAVVRRQAAKALAVPAAAAVARQLTARVTELEDRLEQARSVPQP